jgi:hypothetical protein
VGKAGKKGEGGHREGTAYVAGGMRLADLTRVENADRALQHDKSHKV